jgi:hypothetical protein
MKIPPFKTLSLLGSAALLAQSTFAATLFSDDFDINSSANWTVNTTAGNHPSNLYFDYSTIGIPSAPNSLGGSTHGVKLQSNLSGGVRGGVSISPTGQSFAGDYQLRFDLWMNFNGPAPAGGSGSTQAGGAGIGTAGTTAQWGGSVQDSVHFSTTGDGGATQDFNAYSSAVASDSGASTRGGYLDASGVYAANSRNGNNAYYISLGGATPPAAQTALFAQQTGAAQAGAPAFAWHDVSITKLGNTVTFAIDNLLIATVDASAVTLGGGNILLNYYDINATSSTDVNAGALAFGLYDNVRVLSVVPEPSAAAMLGLGLTLLVGRYRKSKA